MTVAGSKRQWAILLGLALLALLGAAALELRPVAARPALWRISQGPRHAWLFGTIHAVPGGARWLSPAIEEALRDSDMLVLEAAGLEAERKDRGVFEALGRSPGLPPVAARLDPARQSRLAALIKASPDALTNLDAHESWAAALLIGAAANSGATSNAAPEARLESLFRARRLPVGGLETIRDQLGALDTLSAPDQQALLTQAVDEASDAPRLFTQLYARWAAGDTRSLEADFLAPLARQPRLRNALIDQRNVLWARRIDKLLRENGKTPFIAVGAGHLLGPGSVQSRLKSLGWRVERVQ